MLELSDPEEPKRKKPKREPWREEANDGIPWWRAEAETGVHFPTFERQLLEDRANVPPTRLGIQRGLTERGIQELLHGFDNAAVRQIEIDNPKPSGRLGQALTIGPTLKKPLRDMSKEELDDLSRPYPHLGAAREIMDRVWAESRKRRLSAKGQSEALRKGK